MCPVSDCGGGVGDTQSSLQGWQELAPLVGVDIEEFRNPKPPAASSRTSAFGTVGLEPTDERDLV